MPSGIALGGLEPGRGADTGEPDGAGERARSFRTPGRARTGAQNVGNAFAQRPPDFDDVGFGRAFGQRNQRTDRLERLVDQSPGVPRAQEIAEAVRQNTERGTSMKPDYWKRLAGAARRVPVE